MKQHQNSPEQPYQITTAQRLAVSALAGSLLTGVALSHSEFNAPEAHTKQITQRDLNLNAVGSQANIESSARRNTSPTDFSPSNLIETHVSPIASGTEIAPNVAPLPNPPTPERNNLLKLNTEQLVVPKKIENMMRENVAYLPELGCSGFLIKDPSTGEPIGATGSIHCGERANGPAANSTKRYHAENGKTYAVFAHPLQVQTGDSLAKMKTVGVVNELMLDADNDTELDVSIAAFAGHTTEEALDAYNHAKLTSEQISNLGIGNVAYMSGWPVTQHNKDGVLHRQTFAMNILGTGKAVTTGGEEIDAVWTAVQKNKDGAVCSFGASGAQGYVDSEVGVGKFGSLAAFDALVAGYNGNKAQANETRHYWEGVFGVDLSPYGAVCAFAYKTPDANNSEVFVKPITSIEEIPGHGRKALLNRARNEILNPKAKRTIVDGYYAYSPPETAKGGIFKWIDRPLVSVDAVTNSAVISWNEQGKPNNLHQQYIENLDYLTFYKGRSTDADPRLITSKTAVKSVTNGKVPYFKDRNGITFGAVQPESFDPYYFKSYHLKISTSSKGSTYTIVERPTDKGGVL